MALPLHFVQLGVIALYNNRKDFKALKDGAVAKPGGDRVPLPSAAGDGMLAQP